MKLTPMRFKDYTWPHNPETCRVELERKVAVRKAPFGGCVLQDLGPLQRVMRGEGVFAGENAYEEFRKLVQVFEEEGAGTLVHPVWRAMQAYFTALEVLEEPRPDYVRYTFAFWEAGSSTGMTLLDSGRSTEQTESAGAASEGAEAAAGTQTSTETSAEAGTGSYAGTDVVVNAGAGNAASADEAAAAEAEEYYTVVKGDTLWGIGKRYNVTLAELIRLNPQIKNPNLIYPGDEVRVR